jgi:hypothetical protein
MTLQRSLFRSTQIVVSLGYVFALNFNAQVFFHILHENQKMLGFCRKNVMHTHINREALRDLRKTFG